LVSSVAMGETISYAYDATGKRTAMTDQTGTTSYVYHPSGELASITYPDRTVLSFDYDARGIRKEQSIAAGPYRLTAQTQLNPILSIPKDIKVLDGAGGQLGQFTYTYDGSYNRVSQLQSSIGLNESFAYDGLNLTGIQQKQGEAPFAQYAYTYDNNRNITGKTDNGPSFQFTYDPLNRIKTSNQFNERYTYDVRDNRSTLKSDKVPDIQGASYTYDSRNRLTQVKIEKGKTVSYRYNGDGVMVERSEDDVTTRYYYDDRALIVAEGTVNPDGTVGITAAYVHDASGKLLARQVPGQSGLQYYFTNGHGDVTEIRDAQGNLLNRYTYDIWGNPLTEEEQVPNMFRYSGEYWDKTTNLQYLRARWYDPSIGRFITEDPYEGELTNPLSLNSYTYVENNPLTKIDPTGNSAWELCAGSLLCFSAGTKVKTEQGLKPIEEIQVGDQVQTRNEETGELGYHPVEELFQRETDETYHVKVNGTTIITTAEHPFWVAGEGWVEARDLKKGDKLVDLDDQEVPIEDIDVKKERITVYNFRVQGIHNYFVTDLKIWTHNCGGRDGALSGGRMSSSISAPRVGGGGGYSRPANVGRGPAGAKIEIPKNAEQFYKSVLDKGLKSNKGTGKIPSQTVTSNKGNPFDVTPTKNHSTVTVNPKPTGGQPNSSVDIVDPKTGELLTRRWYGPDGRAIRDVDYTHHKNPKTHPEAPHEHRWTYDEKGNPSRSK
ncbi:polymorphic toxin-type HINT domain-containing protein, partial [Paenibacillus apiarius]